MKLHIDIASRNGKMRAHTATHLLHAQLVSLFPQTKQAGSLVDTDLLRFDFQAPRALTPEELTTIEHNINEIIFKSIPVTIQEMSYQEALNTGAKAFFEDKYGDVVRVVTIGDSGHILSQELCGGTHVERTDHIGAFSIINQEAVASGIKRITAITGPQVAKVQKEKSDLISLLAEKVDAPVNQLTEKITKLLKETQELRSQLESFQTQQIKTFLQNIVSKPILLGNSISVDYALNISNYPELKTYDLKTLINVAQDVWSSSSFLFATQEGAYGLITRGTSAKEALKTLGIKGGGNDLIAQGKDPAILNLIS